ncbi:MAG: phosphatase PAP2 family protein [Candidatus Dormibacteraceae bacterium]
MAEKETPPPVPGSTRERYRSGPLLTFALVYLAAVSGFMIWRGISVSPDYLLLLMLPVALASGRFLRFLRDWIPFILIFLAWEAMRGVAPKAGIPPHVGDLAALEKAVFGGYLPTVVLQAWLANPPGRLVAYAATVVYFSHFVFPIGVALALWLVDRRQFIRFTTALMGMAFVAFVIFLLAPTAPPWYADSHGVITGVTKIISTTLPSGISPYYAILNPNPVAAFPSLHAAFPFLGYLAIRETFSRRVSWLALGWCAVVWFSVVYLGEHYVVDVIAGIGLAAATWWVLNHVVAPRYSALRRSPALAASSQPPAPVASQADEPATASGDRANVEP